MCIFALQYFRRRTELVEDGPPLVLPTCLPPNTTWKTSVTSTPLYFPAPRWRIDPTLLLGAPGSMQFLPTAWRNSHFPQRPKCSPDSCTRRFFCFTQDSLSFSFTRTSPSVGYIMLTWVAVGCLAYFIFTIMPLFQTIAAAGR
jgi:hypothetical protein